MLYDALFKAIRDQGMCLRKHTAKVKSRVHPSAYTLPKSPMDTRHAIPHGIIDSNRYRQLTDTGKPKRTTRTSGRMLHVTGWYKCRHRGLCSQQLRRHSTKPRISKQFEAGKCTATKQVRVPAQASAPSPPLCRSQTVEMTAPGVPGSLHHL